MSIKANPFNHADLRELLMIEWDWSSGVGKISAIPDALRPCFGHPYRPNVVNVNGAQKKASCRCVVSAR